MRNIGRSFGRLVGRTFGSSQIEGSFCWCFFCCRTLSNSMLVSLVFKTNSRRLKPQTTDVHKFRFRSACISVCQCWVWRCHDVFRSPGACSLFKCAHGFFGCCVHSPRIRDPVVFTNVTPFCTYRWHVFPSIIRSAHDVLVCRWTKQTQTPSV